MYLLLSVGKTKTFKLILALQENWSGILVATVPGRGGKKIAEMHQYQVKGLVFDDHFEDETFHRRTVVRLGDLDFKPFTAPTLIKSVNFAHRNHRAKGGAQSTWTAVYHCCSVVKHMSCKHYYKGYTDFFLVKHFAYAWKNIFFSWFLDSLKKSQEFFQLNLFYQNLLQNWLVQLLQRSWWVYGLLLAHGTSVRSKLFFFCRWIVPKISCSPFRHQPSSIIHSESWLPWSNNIFPTDKNGKKLGREE